jgi:4-amino-4-deoxy-L-arabinose transferase-like glycosyltransferase
MLLCLLVIGVGGRLAAPHGLNRTFYSDDTATRSDVWGWFLFDGADYRDEDVSNRVDRVRFEGFVWQPYATTWRIMHTGGVEIRINGEVALQVDAPQALTYEEIPVNSGWLSIEATYASGLAAYDIDGRRVEFGVYDNGRLIESHRLYPQQVLEDVVQRETLIYIVTRAALFLFALSLALLVVSLLPFRTPPLWITLVLILIAWVVRYVVLEQRSLNDPFFYYLVPGSDNYVLMARETIMGNSHLAGAFFSPGNTIWMIVLTSIFGANLSTLYLLNSTVGALSVGAICGLGREIGGKWTGIAAGLIGGLFPLLIFYHTTLQLEALLSALLPVSLWLGIRALRQPQVYAIAIFGVSVGFITLLRMTSAVIGIAYVLAILAVKPITLRKRLTLIATATVFALLTVLPQTLANLSIGEVALVNTNGPDTFYWGINRDGNGADVVGEAWYLTRIRRQTYTQAALEDLREQPLRAVELTLYKLGLMLSNTDIANNVDYAAQGLEASLLLNALSLWGLSGATALLFLGFIGVVLLMTEQPLPREIRVMLVASFVFFVVATLAFTVFGRMRAPLWVMLAVFAAFALTYIVRYRLTRKLIFALIFAILLLFSARFFKSEFPRKLFFTDNPPTTHTSLNYTESEAVQPVGWRVIEERCAPDGYLFLSLIWEATKPHTEDQSAVIELRDADGQVVAQRETRIGSVSYPPIGTSQWEQGARLEERYMLLIPDETTEHLELRINAVPITPINLCQK